MFQIIRQPRSWNKVQRGGVQLFLEELEGRCLLSHAMMPSIGVTTGPDGYIWFLEPDRLGRVDPTTGVIREFAVGIHPTIYAPDINSAGNIGPWMAEGLDGNIWFLSDGQVVRFNPATSALDKFNLSAGEVAADPIIVSPDGKIWVLEHPGDFSRPWGLAVLDPSTGAVRDYSVNVGPMAVGPDGTVWIGTGGGGLEKLNPATGAVQQFQTGTWCDGLTVGPDGHVWIWGVMMNPGLREFDPATGTFTLHNLSGIPRFGPDGTIWSVATLGMGSEILEFNPSTGVQRVFAAVGVIWEVTPGPDGNIWFSAPDSSIGRLNPATGVVEYFNMATEGTPPPTTGNPPAASGTTFSAFAGINFTTAVASFTPQNPVPASGSAYEAVIVWGDGSTSNLVLTVADNGTYDVIASHTYQAAGSFNVTVTISPYSSTDNLGGDPMTVFSTVNVDTFLAICNFSGDKIP